MLILTATQQVPYTLAFTDAKGNPARVDGIPQWAASSPETLALTPGADGMSCLAVAGLVGDTQISATADADLGEGTRPVVVTDTVRVVAAEAVAGTMTAGTPEEQPAAKTAKPKGGR
jgi:hypothetical protein